MAENTTSIRTIIYGLAEEPPGIDPHRHNTPDAGIIARQIYDTLLYRDPITGEFVPGLATHWQISEDGLIYIFTLRKNVVFHDGTVFDASAVGRNFERIFSSEIGQSKARRLLGTLTSYQIRDTFTIQLTLSEPFAPLLDGLSQPYLGIASPSAIEAVSLNRYQFHQVGTGPFRLIKYTPGDDIIIERNHNYAWQPDFYMVLGKTPVERVIFRFFPDSTSRAEALTSNTVQIINDLSPDDSRTLTSNSQIKLYPVQIPGQPIQFYINVQQYPTDNRMFRQALLLGTNRQLVTDVLAQGFPDVAWGPLSSGTRFYNRRLTDRFMFDIQQAQALLNSIGFSDEDKDGFIDASGQPLELTIATTSSGIIAELAPLLQQQWLDLGLQVNIERITGEISLQEYMASGEYNLVITTASGFDPVFLNDIFISSSGMNPNHYSNIQLDEALRTAAHVNIDAQRRELYHRIQQFIMDETLILPIYEQVQINATSAWIGGLQFDIYGWYPLLYNVIILEE